MLGGKNRQQLSHRDLIFLGWYWSASVKKGWIYITSPTLCPGELVSSEVDLSLHQWLHCKRMSSIRLQVPLFLAFTLVVNASKSTPLTLKSPPTSSVNFFLLLILDCNWPKAASKLSKFTAGSLGEGGGGNKRQHTTDWIYGPQFVHTWTHKSPDPMLCRLAWNSSVQQS